MLYCTVCDNNIENRRVHNTALELNVQNQNHRFKPKPYEVDMSNPFYRYDPSHCILRGQCVQNCQTVEVNEILRSIGSLNIFFSKTCRSADVVLPGATALEKDGTFISTEGESTGTL